MCYVHKIPKTSLPCIFQKFILHVNLKNINSHYIIKILILHLLRKKLNSFYILLIEVTFNTTFGKNILNKHVKDVKKKRLKFQKKYRS